VYVWQEPDAGGERFVESLRADLPNAHVIKPPDGAKDLSEAYTSGEDVPALVDQLKQGARPISAITTAESLADFASWIKQQLGQRNTRDTKWRISSALAGWLVNNGRLVIDVGQDQAKGGRAYMVDDEHALWPLDPGFVTTRLTLYDAGLNGTEPVYRFVVEAPTDQPSAMAAGH